MPSRFESRIKASTVLVNMTNRSEPFPMIDSAWPETKPWNISAICWIAPGFSTFSEIRTSTKKYEQQEEYQDLHGEGLGDGSLCIVGLDMHGMQNARGQVTKVAVQQDRERICFVHTVVLFLSNLMWTRRETVELLR